MKQEKRGQSLFSTGKVALFFTTLCFQQPLVPKKRFSIFHSICQNSLWTLKSCPLRSFKSDVRRKNGPKTFVILKTAFFKNVCFYWHHRSQRNDLILFRILVRIPSEPYKVRNAPMFVTIDDTRKKGQKQFSSWKQFFFEMFISIGLLGPKKMILSFAQ